MQYRIFVFFLTAVLATSAAAPKKAAPVRGKSTGSRAAGRVAQATGAAVRRGPKAVKRGASRLAAARGPSYQTEPSPERYREIQQALASKGYFRTEPTGVWDEASSDALKQFQMEHDLSPTGKLSAASLIALGLGGGAQTASSAPPAQAPATEN